MATRHDKHMLWDPPMTTVSLHRTTVHFPPLALAMRPFIPRFIFSARSGLTSFPPSVGWDVSVLPAIGCISFLVGRRVGSSIGSSLGMSALTTGPGIILGAAVGVHSTLIA